MLSEYVLSSVSEGLGKFECIGIALCVRVTEKETKYVQSKIHTQFTNQQLTIDSFFPLSASYGNCFTLPESTASLICVFL